MEFIGVICLVNKIESYTYKDVDNITSYISIIQLIMDKELITLYYKNMLSDYSLNSKDIFLANMSHEIRTPLNGIIGYNQLLMQTPLTLTQKNYLTSMNYCSIQLMQIINDILDYTKLASGKMNIYNECFSIKEVFRNVSDAINQKILEKKQNIEFKIIENCPEHVISDRGKLVQILINLLTNASKFSDIGKSIFVSISIIDNNLLQICVKDNGIGITDNDICKLFNVFLQIDASTKKKTGSGLGLAISKKLVNLLDGNIYVESIFGAGSTFTFTIKYQNYEEYEKTMENDIDILDDKTVLVVDDMANNRIVLSEMLFEWKMNPVICASPLEALRMIIGNRYKFDVALIDICMPNISGSELAIQIKQENPYIPLIALSSIDSYVNTSDFEFKLDKPVNKVQLFNTLYRVLSKGILPSAYIGTNTKKEIINIPPTSPINNNKNTKILIAEDILYNSTLLINMLVNIGYENVDVAEDGKEAYDKIKKAENEENPYTILLLDLRMPVMDGHELITTLKKENITYLKIVIITASVMEIDLIKCRENNIEYFINKPIDYNQFKHVILHLTNKQ